MIQHRPPKTGQNRGQTTILQEPGTDHYFGHTGYAHQKLQDEANDKIGIFSCFPMGGTAEKTCEMVVCPWFSSNGGLSPVRGRLVEIRLNFSFLAWL